MEQLVWQIALTQVPGIGDVLARNLVSYCGGVKEIFRQKKARLLQIPGIGEKLAESIVRFSNFKPAEAEVSFIEKHGIKPLFYLDKDYPERLKHLPDAPILLYSIGNAGLDHDKTVGIVGTRKASDYGKAFTEELIEELKPTRALIVSGLALGIDVAAHRSAVRNGLPTIGVMAHGLDRIYPAQHKSIARQMLENGGLLTEFTSGTNPDRENFPKRNRIVAGLCDVLVVIETGIKGGAMITAEIANSYGKEIMAVPGRVNDANSYGCNALIKLNKASILTQPYDLLELMRWDSEKPKEKQQKLSMQDLTLSENQVVHFIRNKTRAGIDDIAFALQVDSGHLSLTLLDLEFKGIIRQLPGRVFELA